MSVLDNDGSYSNPELEASVVSQQLHTVPPYVVGAFFTVLFPLLSTIFDRRIYIMFMSAPFMMIGYIIFLVRISWVYIR